jgi:hypothetical protein
MRDTRQLSGRAAPIEKSIPSKYIEWLRSIAAMLVRAEARIADSLAGFGEFIYPDFFESPGETDRAKAMHSKGHHRGKNPDADLAHPALSDDFKRSDKAKSASRCRTAWNRANARKRRSR